VKKVVCGGWHSIALADTKDLYTWGWNQSGQTGFPAPVGIYSNSTKTQQLETSTEDSETVGVVLYPTLLELESCASSDAFVSITDVSCGTRHTAAVTADGKLITWGWAQYGQLGHASNSKNHCTMHNPHVASWFEEQKLFVAAVSCGPWNTFV
uniref:Uncharacterized protein n=1 Tax=Ciona savignyi TaxID=51511 RepID=H2Y7W6_CIOSA